MKAKTILYLSVLAFMLLPGCNRPRERRPVLVDSDMVESFDDGIAFMMLLGTDGIDVKGLTTVTTNVWAQEGLAYGVRIGELCGGQYVNYVAGSRLPLREGRLDTIDAEIDAAPGEASYWRGAVSYPEVDDWKAFYIDRYARQPDLNVTSEDASEYIARQILSAPGEVTVLAIGACTNIARAMAAHPEIASKAREIVYMGGAVYCPGNTTSYAEMNFLYDPEAAAACLRAPFPKQTVVALDLCNSVTMDYGRFMSLYDSIHSEEIRSLVSGNFPYGDFQDDPSSTQFVWDLISAAIVVDPDIVVEYRDVRLDVDDNPDSPTYGRSFETGDASCRTVRIPLVIDQDRFWKTVLSGISKY